MRSGNLYVGGSSSVVKANSFCQSSSGSVYSQSEGFRLTNEVTAVGLPISAVEAFNGIGKIASLTLTKTSKIILYFKITEERQDKCIYADFLILMLLYD